MEELKEQFAYLKKQRYRFEARFQKIRRVKEEISGLVATMFEPDEENYEDWQDGVALAGQYVKELKIYLDHFDAEMAKTKKGLAELELLKRSKGYKPFKEFIEADLKLSVKNVDRAIKDFDDGVDKLLTMKKLLNKYY